MEFEAEARAGGPLSSTTSPRASVQNPTLIKLLLSFVFVLCIALRCVALRCAFCVVHCTTIRTAQHGPLPTNLSVHTLYYLSTRSPFPLRSLTRYSSSSSPRPRPRQSPDQQTPSPIPIHTNNPHPRRDRRTQVGPSVLLQQAHCVPSGHTSPIILLQDLSYAIDPTRRSSVLCLLLFFSPFPFLLSSFVLISYHVLLGPSEPDRSGPNRLAPRHCCLVDATTGDSFNCKANSYCLSRYCYCHVSRYHPYYCASIISITTTVLHYCYMPSTGSSRFHTVAPDSSECAGPSRTTWGAT